MLKLDPTKADIGNEILPFEMGYLPKFFQKKGEIEINYTQSVREDTLRQIKEAMTKDSTTKDVRISDEMFLLFLTSKKYDVGKAFFQLKKYLMFRRDNEIIFKVSSFEALSMVMTTEFVTVLPWRCRDGCTLVMAQAGTYNSQHHPLEVVQQFYALLLFQCLRDPMTQVNGFKVIFDLDAHLEILKLWTPQNLYTFYYGLQVLFPGRFKGVHILNMGVIGRSAWQVIRIFLPKKMKERVHFHQSYDGLFDYFPKAIVPAKYGGDLNDYDMTEWLKRVSSPEELSWLSCS